MKDKFTVRTEVVSVEFQCSNYARTASIKPPNYAEEVLRVEPLWTSSLKNILISTRLEGVKVNGTIAELNLRWFDSEPVYSGGESLYQIKKRGTMELQVKIYYTSVQLDRQDKLESLGV
jgi:hypothetical protein